MAHAALRKIYLARDQGDAQLLRSLLEAAGISVVVRGAEFVPLQGGSLLHMETRPSLWVLDDDRYPEAMDIVTDYAREASDEPAVLPSWRCRACGEVVEGQFDTCWSCGRAP